MQSEALYVPPLIAQHVEIDYATPVKGAALCLSGVWATLIISGAEKERAIGAVDARLIVSEISVTVLKETRAYVKICVKSLGLEKLEKQKNSHRSGIHVRPQCISW